MSSYAPYVLFLLDLILLFAVCQQLWLRYRIYLNFRHIEVVRELVVHKRKDLYRVTVSILLFIKTAHSLCWLLYETHDYDTYIPSWIFWIFYGVILSISNLLKGDFASVVVSIQQNISTRSGIKQKRFWRGLLFGSAVLSAIIAIWGIILSIYITNSPIWQYMGFSISILNAFITCYVYMDIHSFLFNPHTNTRTDKMTKSILVTTRETQESTKHVRQSITAKEYEKQLYALFNMKQMIAALIFIGLYAIYSFLVNLYFIVNAKVIRLPFQSNSKLYYYSKVITFNLYIYSMIFIIFFYSWLSHKTMKDFAMLSKRKSTLTTQDHRDDIVILPDMMEMEYPPHIDPNNNGNLSNLFHVHSDSEFEHNIYNNSRRSSYNPEPSIQHKLRQAINANATHKPTPSPMSGISDLTAPGRLSSMKARSDDSQIDIFPIFNMKLSVRHQARSSLADEINVDGFIRESKKKHPHTTMFDVPICQMQKKGCSLERIYFDSQKYRGITANSLRLTAKMRSVSYSQTAYNQRHSRNNTEANVSDSNEIEHVEVEEEGSEEISQGSSGYSSSHHSKSTLVKQHVQQIQTKMRQSINITVPEDAVLTPDRVDHSMQIKAKSPQSVDTVEVTNGSIESDHDENIDKEPRRMELCIEVHSGSTEL